MLREAFERRKKENGGRDRKSRRRWTHVTACAGVAEQSLAPLRDCCVNTTPSRLGHMCPVLGRERCAPRCGGLPRKHATAAPTTSGGTKSRLCRALTTWSHVMPPQKCAWCRSPAQEGQSSRLRLEGKAEYPPCVKHRMRRSHGSGSRGKGRSVKETVTSNIT